MVQNNDSDFKGVYAMSKKLAAIEQICMDAFEEIQEIQEDYLNNRIKYSQFELRRNQIKLDKFDTIARFLDIQPSGGSKT